MAALRVRRVTHRTAQDFPDGALAAAGGRLSQPDLDGLLAFVEAERLDRLRGCHLRGVRNQTEEVLQCHVTAERRYGHEARAPQDGAGEPLHPLPQVGKRLL